MRIPLPPAFLRAPIAHRGYHDHTGGCPENSLSAFRAAIEAGYGIELDVQLTGDGQAVVFHDDQLDRMTDATGSILTHCADELGKIRLLDTDDTIPTLADVLALVAGRVPLLIEIKDLFDTMVPTSGRLERAVAKALGGYQGQVAVMSFNPHCVAEIARLAPEIPRGLATEYFDYELCVPIPPAICDRLREIPDYDDTLSSFISHRASDLGYPRVAELKAQGAVILCWTIRSTKEEAEARRVAANVTFEGYAAVIPA